MRDNWCIGFTRAWTVGVWIGNASGEPMWNVTGVDGAAPLWHALITRLEQAGGAIPSRAPEPPPGIVRASGEWYLRGSEPLAALARASEPSRALARIAAPAAGAIIALDPDIPDERERVTLEVAPLDPSLRIAVDGRDLGDAGALRLWAPRRGTHVIALRDGDGRMLDQVRIEVR
jgi:penicillin-binding protein 1C